jgi:delta24-sterol reductase
MDDQEVVQYLYNRLAVILSNCNVNAIDSRVKIDRQPLAGHQVSKLTVTSTETTTSVKLDMKQFQTVLRVDSGNRVMVVEAGCSMEKLFEASEKHNLIPKVLPELKSITVGGAIVGSGLESSSFKYGQFNDICRKVYVLLESNEIIVCSATQHADLYHSLSGSYGTLGSVLCAEIECVEATTHVLVTINGFSSSADGLSYMEEMILANQQISSSSSPQASQAIEFIEGIQYPPDAVSKRRKMAVMTSTLISYSPSYANIPIYHPEASHEEFYYEKIESIIDQQLTMPHKNTSSKNKTRDSGSQLIIPLREFLFRYDHGAFWMAKPMRFTWSLLFRNPLLLLPFFLVANYWICRYLFRFLFTTKILYACLHYAHRQVVAQRMVLMDVSGINILSLMGS